MPIVVRRGGESVGLAPMLVRKRLVGAANVVDFDLRPLVPPDALAETSNLMRRWALRHGVLTFDLAVHGTAEAPPGSFTRAGLNERSEETYLIRLEGRSAG